MRKEEQVERLVTICTRVYCDYCQNEILRKPYTTDEVTISHREGVSYPDDYSGMHVDFDICSGCFKSKVLPFLRFLGFNTEYKEYG